MFIPFYANLISINKQRFFVFTIISTISTVSFVITVITCDQTITNKSFVNADLYRNRWQWWKLLLNIGVCFVYFGLLFYEKFRDHGMTHYNNILTNFPPRDEQKNLLPLHSSLNSSSPWSQSTTPLQVTFFETLTIAPRFAGQGNRKEQKSSSSSDGQSAYPSHTISSFNTRVDCVPLRWIT